MNDNIIDDRRFDMVVCDYLKDKQALDKPKRI